MDPRTSAPVRPALDDVAGLGAFFAASADPAEEVDPTWRPCRDLYRDPGVLADRVALVGRVLGTDDRRVAASIAFQGLAARLVSPVLAVAAGHGLLPVWSPDSLHWRPAVSGPWPLWESAGTATRPDPAELPAAVADALVEPHLAALVRATREVASVSARVLWGNAASAVASAGGLLARSRPAAAARARAVVDAVLAAGHRGAPVGGLGIPSPVLLPLLPGARWGYLW
jgi:hypothetical protein